MCGKMIYQSAAMANRAMIDARRRHHDTFKMRSYYCNVCYGWHFARAAGDLGAKNGKARRRAAYSPPRFDSKGVW